MRIRPGRPRDALACARVCHRSIRDLARRLGQPPPRFRPRDMVPFLRHALRTDPRGFHVAISGGKVVAFAVTVLRAKWHFLALFFALPGKQSRGIGRPVLAAAFEEPRPPTGTVRCVVASQDLRAQALYLKFGMIPRTILYFVSGKPNAARESPLAVELRQVGPVGRATGRALDLAARFDRPLRGARRDVDIRFLMGLVKGTRFYEARRDDRTVGYVILRGNGLVGPAGVSDAALSEGLVTAAISKTRELKMKTVSVWVPGLNQGALRAAFAAGLKVDFLAVWMAAKPLGNLAAYLPANGLLF